MAVGDEDGYFWFKGRADDMITSAGYRIGWPNGRVPDEAFGGCHGGCRPRTRQGSYANSKSVNLETAEASAADGAITYDV